MAETGLQNSKWKFQNIVHDEPPTGRQGPRPGGGQVAGKLCEWGGMIVAWVNEEMGWGGRWHEWTSAAWLMAVANNQQLIGTSR